MPDVIGVRFKPCGKIYDFEVNGVEINRGDLVVVESELGLNIGSVVTERRTIEDSEHNLKKIIRKVTEEDIAQQEENKGLEAEAKLFCLERIMARGLPMKLIATESTLDRKRIIFYFTAEKRIDFRELVKDLASRFKTRIEMRQIGVRDGARIIGSLGICGRELCCKKFLINFEPISIKMAKKQELVLNTGKLSGVCGRLMCCLGYEYSETYTEDVSLKTENIEEEITLIEENDNEEVVVVSSEQIYEPEINEETLVNNKQELKTDSEQKPDEQREQYRRWHPKRKKRRFHRKKDNQQDGK